MGEIDIAICLNKKTEIKRISKKIIKNFLNYDLIVYAVTFSYAHGNK